ncbi:MAG: stage V sporulation protein AD, partial [Acutalibacteraceae bacterium]
YFDKIFYDTHLGQDSWEKAESMLQQQALSVALGRANKRAEDIDFIFAGDLLNQCISSAYGLRPYDIPYLGQYGACSTMAQGLIMAAIMVESGSANVASCVTSSHFCSAERQYRYPLQYGGQRTPTAQWTVTGSGSCVLEKGSNKPFVKHATVGRIVDLGVKDINNMGAAMAPAAYQTISDFFRDTNTTPEDYDLIVTGDLGQVGTKLLYDLFLNDGINIEKKHRDCGLLMYDLVKQDVHSGGSGCGCGASVLCGYFIRELISKKLRNILFVATGALMSPTSNQQGESIPSVAHLINICS